ncbi:dihydrodipicolinate synthase [Carboxydocella sporoproducens DSM 16521]|uniref:4-hydroxy-tetrahydrodipicolinate synthase n=2 Tax=Carboxydocella TaxID=178898 RepID=A0A1T4P5I8_9FIRM|nr:MULTISPECIES: 4-hydroxy-tetrahydrodipicolinate synthase [Carboxydocella]AVX20702.1 dihydrodipicolinate synthase [Carboxydocella thermautotrophica]AVX31121.1 dihydrodipicolinate synthase [Carboxydocella thermautotrophica]GAW28231.1 4-hydroxy-tetrahydrodipicolinate synthase [Carboxydocella sp. ULO1]SJZ86709.1 dihydrodipicolinate synthase [Carboxydocella sporoproducens DSM 16521]
MDFGRLITAMITPFTENDEVNYSEAQKIAQYLVDNGSDGIVVTGTTGESPTLTKEEKIKLYAAVKEAVGNKARVIAGTGSYNTKESIALTKEAEKLGVDGVMLVVPYYNKPCQNGLKAHFRAVAESTGLPIMLYNIPGRTGINLLPETVAELAQVSNIVAIKEASGNLDQVSQLLRLVPANFRVYSGDDSLTLPMLSLGCYGVVSVAAHIVGLQMKKMIESYLAGNIETAASLHRELIPVFKGLFITTNPVPVKTAMALKGFQVGSVRLPLVPATEEIKAAIAKLL